MGGPSAVDPMIQHLALPTGDGRDITSQYGWEVDVSTNPDELHVAGFVTNTKAQCDCLIDLKIKPRLNQSPAVRLQMECTDLRAKKSLEQCAGIAVPTVSAEKAKVALAAAGFLETAKTLEKIQDISKQAIVLRAQVELTRLKAGDTVEWAQAVKVQKNATGKANSGKGRGTVIGYTQAFLIDSIERRVGRIYLVKDASGNEFMVLLKDIKKLGK